MEVFFNEDNATTNWEIGVAVSDNLDVRQAVDELSNSMIYWIMELLNHLILFHLT